MGFLRRPYGFQLMLFVPDTHTELGASKLTKRWSDDRLFRPLHTDRDPSFPHGPRLSHRQNEGDRVRWRLVQVR